MDALAQQAFGDPSLMSELESARPVPSGGSAGRGLGRFATVPRRRRNGPGRGHRCPAGHRRAANRSADQLSQQYAGAALDDIDAELLRAGNSATKRPLMLSTLADLEKALQDQGFFDRAPDGQWRLSPKAMRQLGQTALRDVAGNCRREPVNAIRVGQVRWAKPTGASREWEFGDTEPWDVTRTITNAVLRDPGRMPVRLTSSMSRWPKPSSVVRLRWLCWSDTSFSMVMEDRWVPMKRTALALNHLVSTRFRSDELQLIAFGRHAHVLSPSELAGLDGAWDQGTNLHHALLLAARHLRRHSNAQPVVLIVTDGEPTAHLEAGRRSQVRLPAERADPRFDGPGTRRPRPGSAPTSRSSASVRIQVSRGWSTGWRTGWVDASSRPDLDGLGAAVVSDYMRGRR